MYADVLLYDEPQDVLQKLVSKVMSDDRENVFASEKVPFEAAEFERAYRCRMVLETRLKKI